MIDSLGWRNSFLAATSIGIVVTTVYTVLVPTAGNRSVAAFDFPPRIPLNAWQQTHSQPLANNQAKNEEQGEKIESSRSYGYSQDGKNLTVEMRYLVGTQGNVDSYIENYTDIPAAVLQGNKVKQSQELGYYRLFSYGDRIYLSSCISPRSPSNVTHKQFSENRYRHDLNLPVILDWLRGKASIRDRRCLWTHISTKIDRANPQETYKILETTWSDWYQWWQPQFPNL